MYISDGETIYEGGDGQIDTQPYADFRSRAAQALQWDHDRARQQTVDQANAVLQGLADIVLTPLSQALEASDRDTATWRQAMWDRSESLGQRLLWLEGKVAQLQSYLEGVSSPPPGAMER